MIIINLKGGLGNQMFQYALGRKLSYTTGTELKIDKTTYKNDSFRTYGLGVFKIRESFASPLEIDTARERQSKNWLFRKIKNLIEFRILKKYNNSWEPSLMKKFISRLRDNQDLYLDGYWQSYKYFEDIRSILLDDFTLKLPLEQSHPELVKQVENNNSVSLAVRRSDYLQQQNLKDFGVCSAHYYQKSIELIKSKISNPYFFVVTDDIEWVKKNIDFKGHAVNFISLLRKNGKIKDYQELVLMSRCKHNIIANSTFSWWSAWLNSNVDKIVIAPNTWFSDNSIKIKDIAPKEWLLLPRD